jgi:hypothetical protein
MLKIANIDEVRNSEMTSENIQKHKSDQADIVQINPPCK